jgi:hypothetical protein
VRAEPHGEQAKAEKTNACGMSPARDYLSPVAKWPKAKAEASRRSTTAEAQRHDEAGRLSALRIGNHRRWPSQQSHSDSTSLSVMLVQQFTGKRNFQTKRS